MRNNPLRIVILSLFVVGTLVLATRGQAQVSPCRALVGGVYHETFDGNPSSPQPYAPPCIAVDANNSDAYRGDGFTMDPIDAQHGSDCAPPPAVHRTNTLDHAVHQCRDHIMTSPAGGYAAAYITPGAMLDMRAGEAVFQIDVSTALGSGRDWWDIWVTPFAGQYALPLNDWLPPYDGEPLNAVQVKMEGQETFDAYQFTPTRRGSGAELPNRGIGKYSQWLTPAADVRSTFELRLSRTHIRFCMPAFGRCWIDTPLASPLTFDVGVVQFGHHSYQACKGIGNEQPPCSGQNTFHWDNARLSPALPLDIVPTTPRWATVGRVMGGTTLTLARPAPAGAFVRFAATGLVDLSFNGGATWTAGQRISPGDAPEHYSNYLQPIPQGVTSIRVRGRDDEYVWQWSVTNLHVLAEGAQSPSPSSTPTATSTPTSTSTGIPTVSPTPTSTSTLTATPTLTPTSTATAAPSPPPSPSPSPTPTPEVCREALFRNGILEMGPLRNGTGECPAKADEVE